MAGLREVRLAGLDQIQFNCPFDSRPAIIDVEFTVDALGMGADRAQGDHEFTGDLRTRKLGFEQAENFQLTLAERLDRGVEMCRGRGESEMHLRSLCLLRFKCRQQLACIAWHDPARGSFAKQLRHGWAFIHKHADVALRLSQRQGAFQRHKSSGMSPCVW